MKQAPDLTDDEAVILAWFADFLEQDGIEGLARYLDHCRINIATGMTAGDAILAHYRNPLGYDIDRAAMDLRTWPPIEARILELQTEVAQRRSAEGANRVRKHRTKRVNGHGALHPI